jgi:single-strand DNA-binding protein
MRIACNSSRRSGVEGERVEHANYFDVTVYGPHADNVARYTARGRRVGIDGRLEWREWETDEEVRRQAVSIVASRVQFLDGPPEGSADQPDGQSGEATDSIGAEELEVAF